MTLRKLNSGADSPYCAFKNDRERRLALVSRDIRFVLVAMIGTSAVEWQALWRLTPWG